MLHQLVTKNIDLDREANWIDDENAKEILTARLENALTADPDPYNYHDLTLEHRLVYIEHYLLTGLYAI